ncbi:MAG: putative cytokinetic ring protein SteA [Firmicutes bacterium]|nr:putative cytokinetic ring protein SteA [Bacillota bacterium]
MKNSVIRGPVRLDKKTKNLVKRIQSGDIAVIDHANLDEVAANSLVEAKVKAVVNVSTSMSDSYPNEGPLRLVESGIRLVDCPGSDLFAQLVEGREMEMRNGILTVQGREVAAGMELTPGFIKVKMLEAKANLEQELSSFVQNTMEYAKSEIGLICNQFAIPALKTDFNGKHALIVVRGKNYKEDLKAIKSYIDEINPIIVGVDGGADALAEFGLQPDVIVGDMDSVSDPTLLGDSELVVHAYPDGEAPGMIRLERLGLKAAVYAAPGTSEDIAMLMAYEMGAELIVAVGTHSNMIDFLEKGRKGMASTFLVRAKVGSIMVDAKGVSKLYRSKPRFKDLAPIFIAALLPVAAVMIISPSTRELLRLLIIQFKILTGI